MLLSNERDEEILKDVWASLEPPKVEVFAWVASSFFEVCNSCSIEVAKKKVWKVKRGIYFNGDFTSILISLIRGFYLSEELVVLKEENMDFNGNNSSTEKKTLTKQQAYSLLSSLSLCAEKSQELLSKVQSSHASLLALALGTTICPSKVVPLSNQSCEIQSVVLEVLDSLRKAKGVVNDIMGSNAILGSNQSALLSLINRPSQVPPPLGINQGALPYPNIIPQQNQARLPSFSLNSSPMTNAPGVPSLNYLHRPYQAAFPPPSVHPQKKAAITHPFSIPQQNQATPLPSCSKIEPYHIDFPSSAQTMEYILNLTKPGTNVASTSSAMPTKKRALETLYGSNNKLPERLDHLEPKLIQQIVSEIIDQDTIVKWDDIAGLEHAKNCVHETVLWPILNPKIFQGVCSVRKGVLLFGPPGTGKTMIGKALAGEMKATFFNISTVSLVSKWLGDGEKLVRTLFGRSSITEHESIRRLKTQFLVEMEGIDSGSEQIIVIGATNRPQDLDEAARRRLNKRLYIPLPTSEARSHIVLNTMGKNGGNILEKQDLDLICNLTDGYSGSDMKNLVQEAMMGPIREAIKEANNGKGICELKPEDLRPVSFKDFKNALKEVRPSVSKQELVAYVEWNAKFGSMLV
ncbi:spastin-like [Herrania umbratica]|uniref:Spastin-like n=1 Tax=Herrania umbratica TaxID=108875 RepID=A0A6J1BCP2_9ROSI|nr:spastin-like [Herrania umbratica]